MLEAQLRSGQIVSFDGRVLEVFEEGGASRRFHVEQLPPLAVSDDGNRIALAVADATIAFEPSERPVARRLLAALGEIAQ